MGYVRQFFVILLFSLVGELLNRLFPAPIPASVYGLVLFFLALETGVVKLSAVEDAGRFLLALMPLTLVPLTVGLIDALDVLKSVLVPALLLGIVGTILTALAAGAVAERLARRRERSEK